MPISVAEGYCCHGWDVCMLWLVVDEDSVGKEGHLANNLKWPLHNSDVWIYSTKSYVIGTPAAILATHHKKSIKNKNTMIVQGSTLTCESICWCSNKQCSDYGQLFKEFTWIVLRLVSRCCRLCHNSIRLYLSVPGFFHFLSTDTKNILEDGYLDRKGIGPIC